MKAKKKATHVGRAKNAKAFWIVLFAVISDASPPICWAKVYAEDAVGAAAKRSAIVVPSFDRPKWRASNTTTSVKITNLPIIVIK
mgnify:CR=1 FL=1